MASSITKVPYHWLRASFSAMHSVRLAALWPGTAKIGATTFGGTIRSCRKRYYSVSSGVNVIKLFSFVTDNKANKLKGSSLETLSSQVLEFEGKASAIPTPFRCYLLGKLLVLPANVRVDCKVIARYKHSSLFGLVVRYEGDMFYNIDTWCQFL